MEENFNKDEFEKFIQEQANNHKMFPSDSVWRNINNKLHKDKTWPALTIAALTFIAAIIAISVYFSPGPNIFSYKPTTIQKEIGNKSSSGLLSSVTNNPRSTSLQNWFKKEITGETDEANTALTTKAQHRTAPLAIIRNIGVTELNTQANIIKYPSPIIDLNTIAKVNNDITDELRHLQTLEGAELNGEKNDFVNKQVQENVAGKETFVVSNNPINKKDTRKNRFSYRVYITPSKSFRKLSEDQSEHLNNNTGGPVALNYVADVNKVVRHTPGNGVEAGFAFGYNLTKKFKFTSGIQFNVRQYDIEAYMAGTETATIALQTRSGIDNVTRYSSYRTNSGYALTQLRNRYYQFSIPLGIEYEVVGTKNIGINVAASLQPTYLLKDNSYIISSNFKNYTEGSDMLRRWNVNTSLEAYLSLKSGDFKWQIGPQFRYQQLPTFINEYPIKEHLIDLGVKIGVTRTIQ